MSDDIHLRHGDLERLMRALDAADGRVIGRDDESAAGLDAPEGQERLERLWTTFLSAAAAGSTSMEPAMPNDNQARTGAAMEGVEHAPIDASWFGDRSAFRNTDIATPANRVPQDAAGTAERENQPPTTFEQVTLPDGRTVTRTRTDARLADER